MYSSNAVIKNKTGLHARPASEFVKRAGKFHSALKICRKEAGNWVDGKSIIKVLSLGLAQGEMMEIQAEGEDEKEAVEAMISFVNMGFGEEM
ncbi:HPr family phosphocarrier protein [Lacrimispora sp. 210928-DFI.3.58]|uniref:HPr family phosphocarrier protein n=1 Tax=Lacrimispora sp. 210928-DFI.3.58 TaxID=2883214 RepID=UPI0015B660CF|nr:HPr family phosphocarrier protein [Lacrimispora sp. 210928-DFI.3.58]MCB7320156.1 HPr family phosphocarrier protein [Lacrimispora sp. 210928-DFI.3.58]